MLPPKLGKDLHNRYGLNDDKRMSVGRLLDIKRHNPLVHEETESNQDLSTFSTALVTRVRAFACTLPLRSL